jgi:hypothetical protein
MLFIRFQSSLFRGQSVILMLKKYTIANNFHPIADRKIIGERKLSLIYLYFAIMPS